MKSIYFPKCYVKLTENCCLRPVIFGQNMAFREEKKEKKHTQYSCIGGRINYMFEIALLIMTLDENYN